MDCNTERGPVREMTVSAVCIELSAHQDRHATNESDGDGDVAAGNSIESYSTYVASP